MKELLGQRYVLVCGESRGYFAISFKAHWRIGLALVRQDMLFSQIEFKKRRIQQVMHGTINQLTIILQKRGTVGEVYIPACAERT